jgi:hypothetical protein
MRRVSLVLLLLFPVLLTACNPEDPFKMAPVAMLPDFLDGAPVEVREAYRFAIANEKELEKYPCYCGCNFMGHMNNRDCYIAGRLANGAIKYDEHAVGCGICVEITQDVMRLLRQGKTSKQIRAYIDENYASRGPGTDTPHPM